MFLALTWVACAASPDFPQAQRLYQHTSYEASLRLLNGMAQKDAATWALIGRNQYMLGEYKKASEAFEKAVAAVPAVGEHYLWLGRAYGRRAETSSPFTAPGYAGKARVNFERAVQLDARNMDAMSDLFEYYIEAPGILGGGLDKAEHVADQMAKVDVSEGYRATAKLAEKRKEFGKAEQQLRRALESAPQQVGRIVDLAKFLAKRGRYRESDQVFERALKTAPDSPRVRYAEAEAYVRSGRNLDQARKLLQEYISSQRLTPDDPSRSDAEKLLKKIGS